MKKIIQKIQFQDLAENHTWQGETVQMNGVEVIFENVDDEGYNFLEWSPLFGSDDRHDIDNYVPVVITFGEIGEYSLRFIYIDDE